MTKKEKSKYRVLKTVGIAYAGIILGFSALILFRKPNPDIYNQGFNWTVCYFILFVLLALLLAFKHNKNLEEDTSESGKQKLLHIRLLVGAPFILFPFVLAYFVAPADAADSIHSFFNLIRGPGETISPDQFTFIILGLPLAVGCTAWLLYDDRISSPASLTRLLLLILFVPVFTFAALMLSFFRHFGN